MPERMLNVNSSKRLSKLDAYEITDYQKTMKEMIETQQQLIADEQMKLIQKLDNKRIELNEQWHVKIPIKNQSVFKEPKTYARKHIMDKQILPPKNFLQHPLTAQSIS